MLLPNVTERILDFADLENGEPEFFAILTFVLKERAAIFYPVTSSSTGAWRTSLGLLLTSATTEECLSAENACPQLVEALKARNG